MDDVGICSYIGYIHRLLAIYRRRPCKRFIQSVISAPMYETTAILAKSNGQLFTRSVLSVCQYLGYHRVNDLPSAAAIICAMRMRVYVFDSHRVGKQNSADII